MPLGWVRVLGRRFGWEAGSLAGLALLPLLIMGGLSVLAWWLVKAAVYLGSGPRKCPACGARRWTWPQTGPVSLP